MNFSTRYFSTRYAGVFGRCALSLGVLALLGSGCGVVEHDHPEYETNVQAVEAATRTSQDAANSAQAAARNAAAAADKAEAAASSAADKAAAAAERAERAADKAESIFEKLMTK